MSDRWTFWDYVSPTGNNKIEEWVVQDLSEDGKLLFKKLIANIGKTRDHLQWLGFKRTLKRGRDHLWEIEFYCDRRQYRVLGTFHGQMTAVLLMGCYHKQKIYTPPNAIEEAFKRKRLLMKGEASHYERKPEIS